MINWTSRFSEMNTKSLVKKWLLQIPFEHFRRRKWQWRRRASQHDSPGTRRERTVTAVCAGNVVKGAEFRDQSSSIPRGSSAVYIFRAPDDISERLLLKREHLTRAASLRFTYLHRAEICFWVVIASLHYLPTIKTKYDEQTVINKRYLHYNKIDICVYIFMCVYRSYKCMIILRI